MDPVCFHMGSRPVYWYGVFMALAFMAGVGNWLWLGRREGRDSNLATDLALWAMVGGIVGARLAYVGANWGYYLEHPELILRVDQGGLVYYGGFLGAGVALYLFARRREIGLAELMDFVITAVPLGHALGRVGCFLNGCCVGIPMEAPWGLVTPADGLRFPVQLLEAGFNVVVYAGLAWTYRRPHRVGSILALYLLVYPPGRLLLEFLRGDERLQGILGLSAAQWVSLGLFLVGAGMLWKARRRT